MVDSRGKALHRCWMGAANTVLLGWGTGLACGGVEEGRP